MCCLLHETRSPVSFLALERPESEHQLGTSSLSCIPLRRASRPNASSTSLDLQDPDPETRVYHALHCPPPKQGRGC